MLRKKLRSGVLLIGLIATVALAEFIVDIAFAYDPSNFASNASLVRNEVPQGDVGDFQLADFTNNIRSLYFRQNPWQMTSTFVQVGNGWSIAGPPNEAVCDEYSVTPGCKPIVTVSSQFDRCTGGNNGKTEHEVNVGLDNISRPIETYVYEKQDGSNWDEYWSTTDSPPHYFTVEENTAYRVRGDNVYGQGDPVEFNLTDDCPGNPADPQMTFIPMGCWAGKLPQGELSWQDGQGGGIADYFVVQRFWSGGWQPFVEGFSDCLMANVSEQGTPFRAKAVNISGESDWVIIIGQEVCENF